MHVCGRPHAAPGARHGSASERQGDTVAPAPRIEWLGGAGLEGGVVTLATKQEQSLLVSLRNHDGSRLKPRGAMHRAEDFSDGVHHILGRSYGKSTFQHRRYDKRQRRRWRRGAGALDVFDDGRGPHGCARRRRGRRFRRVAGRIIAEPRDVSKRLHRAGKCLLPLVVCMEAIFLEQSNIPLRDTKGRTKIVNEQVQDALCLDEFVLWHVR